MNTSAGSVLSGWEDAARTSGVQSCTVIIQQHGTVTLLSLSAAFQHGPGNDHF